MYSKGYILGIKQQKKLQIKKEAKMENRPPFLENFPFLFFNIACSLRVVSFTYAPYVISETNCTIF